MVDESSKFAALIAPKVRKRIYAWWVMLTTRMRATLTSIWTTDRNFGNQYDASTEVENVIWRSGLVAELKGLGIS